MAEELVTIIKQRKHCYDENIRILDIGCGTGYLTKQLADLFPSSKITAIDIAPGMIDIVKSEINRDNIDYICADIEEFEFTANYDLIISNATFQWLNHPEKTLKKLYKALNPNSVLCFSTFGEDTFRELYESFEISGKTLGIDIKPNLGQSFYSLNALKNLCVNSLKENTNKFLISCFQNNEYEYFDYARDFLSSVKRIGANNCNKHMQYKSRTLLNEMIKTYDTRFRQGNKVIATYHCIYYLIEKLTKI
jgi:malonyl-CoA O-methyltransferase